MAAGADGGRKWWSVGAVSLVVPPLVIDCYGIVVALPAIGRDPGRNDPLCRAVAGGRGGGDDRNRTATRPRSRPAAARGLIARASQEGFGPVLAGASSSSSCSS